MDQDSILLLLITINLVLVNYKVGKLLDRIKK